MRFLLSILTVTLSTPLLYAATEDPTEFEASASSAPHRVVGRASPTAEGTEVAGLLQAARLSSPSPAPSDTDNFQPYEDLIQDWSLHLAGESLTPGAYIEAARSIKSSLTTTLTSLIHDLREARKALRAFKTPGSPPRIYLLTDQEAAETHLRERLKWEQVEDKLTFLGGVALPTFKNLWAKKEKAQRALGALPPAFDFVEGDNGFGIYEKLVHKWATRLTKSGSPEEYAKTTEEVSAESITRLASLISGQRELEEQIRQLSTDEEVAPVLYARTPAQEAAYILEQLDVEALTGQDLSERRIGKLIGNMYRTALLEKFRALFEGNEALVEEREFLLTPPHTVQI